MSGEMQKALTMDHNQAEQSTQSATRFVTFRAPMRDLRNGAGNHSLGHLLRHASRAVLHNAQFHTVRSVNHECRSRAGKHQQGTASCLTMSIALI